MRHAAYRPQTFHFMKTTLDPATNCRPQGAAVLPPGTDARRRASNITEAVHEAVRRVHDRALRPVARADAGLAYHPKSLLSVLAYCYAWEVYSSTDIENWMMRDQVFREACHNEFPNARQLRNFRRHNGDALKECVAEALRWLSENTRANLPAPSDDERYTAEAQRRIEMARFVDSVELDGD